MSESTTTDGDKRRRNTVYALLSVAEEGGE